MALTIVMAVLGLVFLVVGAELLIKGASRLATSVGVSPLVVGLTVVAFGTSAPELAVSLSSSIKGQADIALGNVVGSNIFNVLFILGASAMVAPLIIVQKLLRVEVPLMVGSAAMIWLLGFDGRIERLDGGLLIFGIFAYTIFAIRQSRKEPEEVKQEYAREVSETPGGGRLEAFGRSRTGQLLHIALGLAMLVLGSQWMVDGAVMMARALGVTELVIGLTIVAVGTSLPEVATSVMASLRREQDIAVGNVVGSNIFNVLAVLGFSSTFSPDGVSVSGAALQFDVPFMIAVSLACIPVFFSGGRISRGEGALFLAYYGAYTTFLVLTAKAHPLVVGATWALAWFVVPLMVVTLGVLAVSLLQARRPRSGIES
jgi:cation:H+ antiporter